MKSILAWLQLLVVISWSTSVVGATIPDINSVALKPITVLPSVGQIIAPPPLPDPKVPTSVAAPTAAQNFRLWIYEPRFPGLALGSPGIFISLAGAAFNFVPAAVDGTLYMSLGAGQYEFDVVEPESLTNQLARRRYSATVSATGTVAVADVVADTRGIFAVTVTPKSRIIEDQGADPLVPTNVALPTAAQNFRLWVFDPRNRSTALGSPGIFISTAGGAFTFVPASADSTLYMQLGTGLHVFDVLEPASGSAGLSHRRYMAAVSADGTVFVSGKVADTRGIFAVTVTITTVNSVAQQRLKSLTATASESALTFRPTSACQLIDQITPNRTLNVELSAGFPRVRTRMPAYGRVRVLIVPLDFAEYPGVESPATFFTPLADSVSDFYHKQSYGRLAFDFEVLPNWLRLPFLASKYRLGNGNGAGNPNGYRQEIVELTDALIDYSQYDAVYFLLPKQVPFSVVAYGPAITYPIVTRNGYITNGASSGADMYLVETGPNAARNWLAHEIGHTFGLYDEDLDHASHTLGSWSVMGNSWSRSAIEHNGWDRYLIGWLDESQVACLPRQNLGATGTTVKLNALVRQNTDVKVAMIPLSTSKMLVMESRKSEGFDTILPALEGVLVYTVDMKIAQLKGGYQTQRRTGSTARDFVDAALRTGDSIMVDGIEVTVLEIGVNGDTIRVKSISDGGTSLLTMGRDGLGAGTISSNPIGVICTSSCAASFATGTAVTLSATATTGSTFAGWSGECTGIGACTVVMGSAKNVSANFTQNAPATYSGLWWNQSESGWGMSLTQRDGIVFMAWYTYDDTGAPVWYVISNCPLTGGSCSGDIYAVSGGRAVTTLWNNPILKVSLVGKGTITFSDVNTGSFNFTLNGISRRKEITRQVFGTGTAAPVVDYTALYWAAPASSESGWGVSITQQFGTIFVALYTYDTLGKPIWYVASNCPVAGTGCAAPLYQVNGGRVPSVAWGNPALDVKPVGNITFSFTEASNGTMSFTIHNITSTKAITKQIF